MTTKLRQLKKVSQITAFGEAKVAEYIPQAAWNFTYGVNARLIKSNINTTGTVTNEGAFGVIRTGTDPNGRASIQTRDASRYHPGIGGLIRFTAIYSEGVPDSTQFVGAGDSLNGLAFGFFGDAFGIAIRNGGQTLFVREEDWSESDPDGPGGAFLQGFDPTLLNVYQIQYQWLGGGEIRFYVQDPGIGAFVLVHAEKFANKQLDVSMQNPSLPLAASVTNIGNTTDLVIKTPSGTIGSEGKLDGTLATVNAAENTKAITSEEPVLSVRNAVDFNGRDNAVRLNPLFFTFASDGNKPVTLRVYLDASLTGAVFTPVDPGESPAEADASATAFTGGDKILAFTIGKDDSQVINMSTIKSLALPPGGSATFTAESASSSDVTIAVSFTNDF